MSRFGDAEFSPETGVSSRAGPGQPAGCKARRPGGALGPRSSMPSILSVGTRLATCSIAAQPRRAFVVVQSAADPRFERHGSELWRRQEITVAEAVLGTERTIPSLDGSINLEVPAGTQPGLVLRLRGKGLPRFGGGGPGDLYIRVDVRIPERLSEHEREFYEQLRALEAHGLVRDDAPRHAASKDPSQPSDGSHGT